MEEKGEEEVDGRGLRTSKAAGFIKIEFQLKRSWSVAFHNGISPSIANTIHLGF